MRGFGVWDADRAQAALNVFGGAAFAIGSLLLLDRSLAQLGVVFFVIGSFALFFGAVAVWRQRYAPGRAARAPAPVAASAAAPITSPVTPPVAAPLAATPRGEPEPPPDGVTSPAEPGSSPGSLRGG